MAHIEGAVQASLPHEHHHPEPGDGLHHFVHVDRQGMSDRLPEPGECFFVTLPGEGDPDYVTHRFYLTIPRMDKPGWWVPNYCWIGEAEDCHQWNGDLDSPTITPSILEACPAPGAEPFHGYLTAGVLTSV